MSRMSEMHKKRLEKFKEREFDIKDKIMDVAEDVDIPDLLDAIKNSGSKPRKKVFTWLRRAAFWLIKQT